MARRCSMDGAIEQFDGDDEMMGQMRRPAPKRAPASKKVVAKQAIAAKAKATAKTAKVAKAAAKKVAKAPVPTAMKKEALSIAAAAAQVAQRAAKLSSMAGVEPVLMGDAGDYYNIGAMQMGAIEQFSGVEPLLMGEADFGDADFGDADFGEDDGMMGGLMDTLKSPMGMAALAIGGWFLWKKMKK